MVEEKVGKGKGFFMETRLFLLGLSFLGLFLCKIILFNWKFNFF